MKAYLDDFRLIHLEEISNIFDISFIVNKKSVDIELVNNDIKLNDDYIFENDNHLYINNQEVYIESRFIEHQQQFDELFCPDLSKLGYFYSKEKTIFRVWSPVSKEVFLVLNNHKYKMSRSFKGIYEIEINKDLELSLYHYELINNENTILADDPFGYIKKDDLDSYIIDINKLNKTKYSPKPCASKVVYELSIRDYTSNIDSVYSKTFKGLGDNIDYLKELGISHVQLMPIMDFDNDNKDYNWGYNPLGFNSFKNDYFYNKDPYSRLNELKEMVNTLHLNDIRVILDVVYNHVYKKDKFNLAKYLKYYFYRYKDGVISNAVGLGNELRSESQFLKEYLSLMSLRLFDIYDIDGLRYDLSGLIDKELCIDIQNKVKSIKSDALFIGEGWNIEGTSLRFEDRCCLENSKDIEGIYFFNPLFRDILKGNDKEKGLLLQNESLRQKVKEILTSSNYLLNRNNSLNYVECHDDQTIFDYLKYNLSEDDEMIKKRCRFALALVILSKGLPFIHSGQEFYRTKKGEKNSYNLDDSINLFDWKLKDNNLETVEYFKELINTRKKIIEYLNNDIAEYIDYYEAYIIKIKDLYIAINPCPFKHLYVDGHNYQVLFDGNKASNETVDGIRFPEYTVSVFKKMN